MSPRAEGVFINNMLAVVTYINHRQLDIISCFRIVLAYYEEVRTRSTESILSRMS